MVLPDRELGRLELRCDLVMELQTTRVLTCPGVERIPFVDKLFMDRSYPVNSVWKLLPWNGGPFDGRPPVCRMRVVYLDEQMRISRDAGGGLFVYTRPMAAPTARGPGGADDTA